MSVINVKLLSNKAKIPTKAHYTDAGFDLYSTEEVLVDSWDQALINTDIALDIPKDGSIYGRIAPRSGLSLRHGLDVGAGVIDASYSGPIKVLIRNLSDKKYIIKIGDRIAQIIMTRIYPCSMVLQVKNDIVVVVQEVLKVSGPVGFKIFSL